MRSWKGSPSRLHRPLQPMSEWGPNELGARRNILYPVLTFLPARGKHVGIQNTYTYAIPLPSGVQLLGLLQPTFFFFYFWEQKLSWDCSQQLTTVVKRLVTMGIIVVC